MYDQVMTSLRAAYNHDKAEERDRGEITPWKVEERQLFLALLQKEGKGSLLEIGAGPGRDSKFFQDNGLQVTSTDLSPAMVNLCQQKGLTAYVMDFQSLDFPARSFDAIYALNCLLHVPTKDLPTVLSKIQSLLKPDGLFYLGVYGGDVEREGIEPEDHYEPKRFFSYHTDAYMQQITTQFFALHSFKPIPLENSQGRFHFQSIVLRNK